MRRIACTVFLLALAHGAVAPLASAQARPVTWRDRFEVSVGGLWIGGAALGSTDANLRANSLTPAPFRLFAAETNETAAPGFDVRFGYWLTQSIAVEAGVVRVRPELETRIDHDAEGAAALTVAERFDQYFIDANVVWLLNRFRFHRAVPFVSGGAGYLRQLHEGQTLVETGQVYQMGGGIRHELASDVGWFRAIGLRFDGRLYVLVDGVQFEDRPRRHGALTAALFATF